MKNKTTRNAGTKLAAAALRIVQTLREAGFEALLAGGCVRDRLMRRRPQDIDIATSATPDEVIGLFRRTIPVGKQFGVVIVVLDGVNFEVATFRRDSETSDGRRPDAVTFSSAREDALRRDFTVNGMFFDPVAGRVIDYVGGRADLKKKVVRTIGDPELRFREDFLRMLRAVRFSAKLGFRLDACTARAIRKMAPSIRNVSAERIREELTKIFTGPRADEALDLLHRTGLLHEVLPEIEALRGVKQPPQFHPEGDVYKHVRMMLGMLKKPSPVLAFAALLHDVGKPATFRRAADRIRFSGHDVVGARLTEGVCRRLKFDNDTRKKVVHCVQNHMRVMTVKQMRLSKLKRLMQEETFEDELELHRIDCLASHKNLGNWRFLRTQKKKLGGREIKPPKLIGGDDLIRLGLSPGPLFKTILTAVETAQLENQISTREEALAFIQKDFLPSKGSGK